ncbi:MAG: PEP-CTERM sorting domain-containing protein [Chthoniobacterales bacterium]|nr:PEP-CTERM sorting domain-containing protein [Chthoniobacterales bacterium]
MRKIVLVLLFAAPLTSWSQLITVSSFDDIQYWAGSGTNRAALVLEFSNAVTPSSIAWGYQWNGISTADSMLFALAGAITGSNAPSPLAGSDMRLSVDVSFFANPRGYFVNTIRYDQNGLPSPWSQSIRFIQNNYFGDGTYPTIYSLDSTGLWSSSFTQAQVGMSDLVLSDGMWVGFAQSDGIADPRAFAQAVAAVPEPSSLALLVLTLSLALATKLKTPRR